MKLPKSSRFLTNIMLPSLVKAASMLFALRRNMVSRSLFLVKMLMLKVKLVNNSSPMRFSLRAVRRVLPVRRQSFLRRLKLKRNPTIHCSSPSPHAQLRVSLVKGVPASTKSRTLLALLSISTSLPTTVTLLMYLSVEPKLRSMRRRHRF